MKVDRNHESLTCSCQRWFLCSFTSFLGISGELDISFKPVFSAEILRENCDLPRLGNQSTFLVTPSSSIQNSRKPRWDFFEKVRILLGTFTIFQNIHTKMMATCNFRTPQLKNLERQKKNPRAMSSHTWGTLSAEGQCRAMQPRFHGKERLHAGLSVEFTQIPNVDVQKKIGCPSLPSHSGKWRVTGIPEPKNGQKSWWWLLLDSPKHAK